MGNFGSVTKYEEPDPPRFFLKLCFLLRQCYDFEMQTTEKHRVVLPHMAREAIFLLCGLLVGGLVSGMFPLRSQFTPESSLRAQGDYKFTNPLLTCGSPDNKSFEEFSPFKKELQDYIDTQVSLGTASKIGFYFRDLNGARWFGINENEQFSPASLLKVPLMIAYYKFAETHPDVLDSTLWYGNTVDANQGETFVSSNPIVAGQAYTVRELLSAMIEKSDNNATNLLSSHINKKSLSEVYTDLGLSVPYGTSATVDFMSAKSYSYFFRVLYNATYVSRTHSEQALGLLAAPDFPNGLQASVPTTVEVAQKFGERTVLSPNGAVQFRELHDCGIVYYPNQPYLLCVMTKGQNFDELSAVIRSVGKLIYKMIDTTKK